MFRSGLAIALPLRPLRGAGDDIRWKGHHLNCPREEYGDKDKQQDALFI